MILCKVLGPVVSTEKHPAFAGLKLLVVQPVDEEGAHVGKSFLAVDRAVQAGEGDTVLVLREGTGIRQLFGVPLAGKLPIRSCIVGIVDATDGPGRAPAVTG
jgi:microcompartment protein CcmK/EutM